LRLRHLWKGGWAPARSGQWPGGSGATVVVASSAADLPHPDATRRAETVTGADLSANWFELAAALEG
jgi:hypothetical protein